jgi:hypothetical protein
LARVGDVEDRIAELKSRVKRLDGAMAELERVSRRPGTPSAYLREAVRDFDRDLRFLQRSFAQLQQVAEHPAGEG